jgi:hypothetical protein
MTIPQINVEPSRVTKRQGWRKAGLCSLCGKGPAVPGLNRCALCREKAAKRRQDIRDKKVCTHCCGVRDDNGTVCKACKQRRWAERFGISYDECAQLFITSKGCCSTCSSAGPLVIDHDHSTGKVRGILCKQCNIALGGVRDDPRVLQALIEYLNNPPANKVLGDHCVPKKPRKTPEARKKRDHGNA